MPRRVKISAIAAVVIAILLFAILPPATEPTSPPPSTTVRGVFHVHSDRSDGSGSVDSIAAAASRAGVQFVILTDHGDGTRAPDAPSYRSGVLMIDGVELNTTGGHYAVMGLPASPYPLAGAPDDVIEDVHRLGGFGIAAHPGSPRPSLSWQEWTAAFDGLEWINADSEWRDESHTRLARAILTYPFRAAPSMATLLDRPDAVLRAWDEMARHRRIIGLAASDAHARLGFRQRTDPDGAPFHVPFPSYESSFKAFSNHVLLETPLTGDPRADARRLLEAIRFGRVYTVIDALATPGSLQFSASSGAHTASVGGALPIDGDLMLRASATAPSGTSIVLLRNGQRVHQVSGGALEFNGGREPASYRIEAYTATGASHVPWIVSNPIYAGLPPLPVRDAMAEPVSRIPARTSEVAAEHGPRDSSSVVAVPPTAADSRTFTGDAGVEWTLTLSPGTAMGQFAAAAIPIDHGVANFARVRFTVSSSTPMRVWVQLRAPAGNPERWGATFFTDGTARVVDIPFARFRPIGTTSSAQPPLDRVDSLLFVVDTLNTLPGSNGQLRLSDVGFVK